jgi:hypothetical protein
VKKNRHLEHELTTLKRQLGESVAATEAADAEAAAAAAAVAEQQRLVKQLEDDLARQVSSVSLSPVRVGSVGRRFRIRERRRQRGALPFKRDLVDSHGWRKGRCLQTPPPPRRCDQVMLCYTVLTRGAVAFRGCDAGAACGRGGTARRVGRGAGCGGGQGEPGGGLRRGAGRTHPRVGLTECGQGSGWAA